MYNNNSLRNAFHLIANWDWSINSGADIAAEIPRIHQYGYFIIEAGKLRAVRIYTDKVLKSGQVLSTAETKFLLDGLLCKFFPDKPLYHRETKVGVLTWMQSRQVLGNVLNRSLIDGISRISHSAILIHNLEERLDKGEVWVDSRTVKGIDLIPQILLLIFVLQKWMSFCLD